DEIAEPPRAARGTSNLPALVKETPVDQPSFEDRGDTIEHRPELDPFENRQATYVELDPFGADDHAAVTIDYRIDTPPELDTPADPAIGRGSGRGVEHTSGRGIEHASGRALGRAIGTGRTQALPPGDAPDEEPTAPLDDEIDELATYAVIVEQPRADSELDPHAVIGERADAELDARATLLERRADAELDARAMLLQRRAVAHPALPVDSDVELALAATLDVRAVSESELDASSDELVTALERGFGISAVDRRTRSDSAELQTDGEVDALLGDLERELRANGTLSFATCEALRTDRRLGCLENCLAFLRCTVFAGDANIEPIGRRRRVQMCRLLLLSIAAHTQSPRWSAFQLEQMLEVALSIPGAELSDLVQALFALLVDSRGPASVAQARFIRELGAHVTGKRRRGHSADDFVWIAVRLADPLFPATEAQAFLAAHVLPRKLRVVTRETITRAVRSSVLAEEVAHILAKLP
ncbi:MAG TPA: hypothetical protein VIU61_05085, partial [Kofleriaceae bacterium]